MRGKVGGPEADGLTRIAEADRRWTEMNGGVSERSRRLRGISHRLPEIRGGLPRICGGLSGSLTEMAGGPAELVGGLAVGGARRARLGHEMAGLR
ncbi:hypothetical protein Aph02nite_39520 [Actinoplanes philippinensis]|nr:hypothetical protein Aph02nite_39520 [Actinoplanes philippinensis]